MNCKWGYLRYYLELKQNKYKVILFSPGPYIYMFLLNAIIIAGKVLRMRPIVGALSIA